MTLEKRDWLNTELLQKILQTSECDDTIEVKDITTKPATQNGDNYMSEMIRVGVEYSRKQSEKTEKISLIFKVGPTVNGANYNLISQLGAFETEIKMMEDTLVKMNDILNEKDYRLSARVLHTQIKDPKFLVIDDLAPMGYHMADRKTGLDLEHCTIAIRSLAKFHASSAALCEKEPQQRLSYTRGVYHEDNPEVLKKFFRDGLRIASKEIATWPELGSSASEYSEKLLKLSEVCYERATECAKPRNDELNVIIHGDCWVNNMLFRYNENGKIDGHIFVDFQASLWTSPAMDIVPFLSTSATDDVYVNHREALLEDYLEVLSDTMRRVGCKAEPPSIVELQKYLEDREFVSVLSSTLGLAFVLNDHSETRNIEDIMMDSEGYENPAYKSQPYRKIMIRRLNSWNAKGLLEV